jgi:tryptophanyl-tRNA synthetase
MRRSVRRKVSLTGIKPTGIPHLGNYVGAIRPALGLAEEFDAFYFIADYHALNVVQEANTLRHLTYEVAAAWLAMGLDPDNVTFYRQSDVPETFELFTILTNLTPKGYMNRAHAYKAAVARNEELRRDPDEGINMGLYNYPILMAADILLFSADVVPVGRDQVQHVEIARDIAEYFNKVYGETLTVPDVHITEAASISGIDGRKMSKSYENTIPLFTISSSQLRKLIRRYITDSTPADAPKDADHSGLFQIYREIASGEDVARVRAQLVEGSMSWGRLKDLLFEALDHFLAEPRLRYRQLINHHEQIDYLLRAGAGKARPRAQEVMRRVRAAIGVDAVSA